MKTNRTRWIAAGTLSALTLGSAPALVAPAHADADTWKKAAIVGAGVTGYGLLAHKGRVATIGGIATAGSYYMYKTKKKKEDKQRQAWYRRRYGRNWRSHYRG